MQLPRYLLIWQFKGQYRGVFIIVTCSLSNLSEICWSSFQLQSLHLNFFLPSRTLSWYLFGRAPCWFPIYIFHRIGKNIDHCQQLMKQIQQSMRVFAFILLGTIKSVFHGNFGLNSLKKQAIWLPWTFR